MKVLVDKIGEVALSKNDFVDSGGEGDVYIKNNLAYKIYHDPKRMIPVEKINELQSLEMSNIIKPESVIYNVNREAIGYTMRVVKNYYPLSRLITNDFRQQHNIDNDKILNLILIMKQTIQHIHEKGCLFVDANEMNFLVSDTFDDVYFIDVDSYKTKKNKATAYTEIALDPTIDIHNQKTLSTKSDWYSFAVLACKIFTGIHPFKGKFKDKKKMNIKDRMNKGISIFNKSISLPKTARDLNNVPDNFREWFVKVFENGERIIPPNKIDKVYYQSTDNMILKDFIQFTKIKDFLSNIEYVSSFDSKLFVKTAEGIETVNDTYRLQDRKNTYPFYSFFKGDLFLKLNKENQIQIYNLKTKEITESDIYVDNFFVQDNIAIGQSGDNLYSLSLFENNNVTKLVIEEQTSIYEKSLRRFNNVFINKLYDKNIIIIPIDSNVIYKERLADLDSLQIIDAKYQNKILGVSFFDKNKILKTRFYRFSESLNSLEIIKEEEDIELDFVVTEKGVVLINLKDKILLMSNSYGSNNTNEIEDKNLNKVRLYSNKNGVFAISNNSLYTISMS